MSGVLPSTRRQRGQILPLFAISILAMLAITGLVVDGSTLFIQRRTAQNAADAAALAGARALSTATNATENTVATAICKYALANSFGTPPQVTSAIYVKSDGTSTGTSISVPANCATSPGNTNIPSNAAGVQVFTQIGPYSTFIVGIVGLSSLSASASASSMVGGLASIDFQSGTYYLAGCGPDMVLTTVPYNVENIFIGGTPPAIDYATYAGHRYMLESQKMNSTQNPNVPPPNACPHAPGQGYWGAINDSLHVVGLPASIPTQHGLVGVAAINVLCAATNQPTPTSVIGCYLPFPITDNNNNQGGDSAHVVAFGCFQVFFTNASNNIWEGILSTPSSCPPLPNSTYGTWTFSTRTGGFTKIGLSS